LNYIWGVTIPSKLVTNKIDTAEQLFQVKNYMVFRTDRQVSYVKFGESRYSQLVVYDEDLHSYTLDSDFQIEDVVQYRFDSFVILLSNKDKSEYRLATRTTSLKLHISDPIVQQANSVSLVQYNQGVLIMMARTNEKEVIYYNSQKADFSDLAELFRLNSDSLSKLIDMDTFCPNRVTTCGFSQKVLEISSKCPSGSHVLKLWIEDPLTVTVLANSQMGLTNMPQGEFCPTGDEFIFMPANSKIAPYSLNTSDTGEYHQISLNGKNTFESIQNYICVRNSSAVIQYSTENGLTTFTLIRGNQ
jgi:hypothetical protein